MEQKNLQNERIKNIYYTIIYNSQKQSFDKTLSIGMVNVFDTRVFVSQYPHGRNGIDRSGKFSGNVFPEEMYSEIYIRQRNAIFQIRDAFRFLPVNGCTGENLAVLTVGSGESTPRIFPYSRTFAQKTIPPFLLIITPLHPFRSIIN